MSVKVPYDYHYSRFFVVVVVNQLSIITLLINSWCFKGSGGSPTFSSGVQLFPGGGGTSFFAGGGGGGGPIAYSL